jgi:hypothetical protein
LKKILTQNNSFKIFFLKKRISINAKFAGKAIMKNIVPAFLLSILLISLFSCQRDKHLTDTSVKLTFSADTVLFDTVFTTIGSSTRQLKVYNPYNRKVLVSSIRLASGENSLFRINVDGIPGPSVRDIEILAKDSIFIFVEVTVNPLSINSPLILNDSIFFEINGNSQDVDLVAWGQNAHYIRPTNYISGLPPFSIINCDTTWTNNLPHVIYGYAVVDSSCKLNIEEGTRIHFHNGSGLWVYKGGSIKVNGTKEQPVIFQGDRLEAFYREVPGQWDRIWLNEGSVDNEFNYVIIKNGVIGIQAEILENLMGNKLKISNSIITNMSRSGILSRYYKIEAGNTVIANCGMYATELTMGGEYDFTHCTFANNWSYKLRKTPSVLILNYIKDQNNQIIAAPLQKADFKNCIIYGNLENEILEDNIGQGVEFNYSFNNCLIKTNRTLSGNNIILNQDPMFRKPLDRLEPDYQLQENSPAINKGNPAYATGIWATDKNEVLRTGNPDLGAYEFVP